MWIDRQDVELKRTFAAQLVGALNDVLALDKEQDEQAADIRKLLDQITALQKENHKLDTRAADDRRDLESTLADLERANSALDGFEALLAYRKQMADLELSQEVDTQIAAANEWEADYTELNAIIEGLNAHAHIQADQLETQVNRLCLQQSRRNKAEDIADGLNAHAHIQAAELAAARMRIGVLDTTLTTRDQQITNACDKIVALRDQLDAFKALDRRALVHAMRDIHTELALEPSDEPLPAPWAALLDVLDGFTQALRVADPSLDDPAPEPAAEA